MAKEHTMDAWMTCYQERAHLLALLAAIYPSHGYVPDDAEPGFTQVLCIHFPWGQATWHIADSDRHLFTHVELTTSDYDGHTTAEKYEAMQVAATRGNVVKHG